MKCKRIILFQGKFGRAVQACKGLCYEDLVLWVVQNPEEGKRDILAMTEVALRHHGIACSLWLMPLEHSLGPETAIASPVVHFSKGRSYCWLEDKISIASG